MWRPDQVHAALQGRVLALLWQFAHVQQLGEVYGPTCFRISPSILLTPDISFVSREKLARFPGADKYLSTAPDLAVEITYNSDLVNADLVAGASLVWQIMPNSKQIVVHRPDR